MTNAQFAEKHYIVEADNLLTLDDKVLFNIQIVDVTTKALWDNLHKVCEDKPLMNKIFLRK